MSAGHYVLGDDSLEISRQSVTVLVGLPWYRSLPWASLDALDIVFDAAPVTSVLRVDAVPWPQLKSLPGYWPLGHRARVTVSAVRLPLGAAVEVEVRGRLLVPSPVNPDGSPLVIAFGCTRQLHGRSAVQGSVPPISTNAMTQG